MRHAVAGGAEKNNVVEGGHDLPADVKWQEVVALVYLLANAAEHLAEACTAGFAKQTTVRPTNGSDLGGPQPWAPFTAAVKPVDEPAFSVQFGDVLFVVFRSERPVDLRSEKVGAPADLIPSVAEGLPDRTVDSTAPCRRTSVARLVGPDVLDLALHARRTPKGRRSRFGWVHGKTAQDLGELDDLGMMSPSRTAPQEEIKSQQHLVERPRDLLSAVYLLVAHERRLPSDLSRAQSVVVPNAGHARVTGE